MNKKMWQLFDVLMTKRQFLIAVFVFIINGCRKPGTDSTVYPPPAPVVQSPTINSFIPEAAAKDSIIVINGANFSSLPSENLITFNGIPGSVISASTNRLEVRVPQHAANGKIILNVGNKMASSVKDFTYLFTVSTIAGSNYGFLDAADTLAKFAAAFGITTDNIGNIIVADGGNNRIRKINPAGIVSTIAGNDAPGVIDGPIADARFNYPRDVAMDAAGNIYVADAGNNLIRKITPAGIVSTVAGNGIAGFADGQGTTAQFNFPVELVVDASGNIFVTDGGNHRIRKITPTGQVTTIGAAIFGFPEGIAIDPSGNLFIADAALHKIFKVTQSGDITAIAGNGMGFTNGSVTVAQFNNPEGIAIDKEGNLFIGDLSNNAIRKITPAGVVSTFAGGVGGFLNGEASIAKFREPSGVIVDKFGNIIVADALNSRIRIIQ